MTAHGFAVNEFHSQKWPAILLANVVHGADVGVIQRRRSERFTAKSLHRLRIVGQIVRKKFQRNVAFQAQVLRLVHNSHAAGAQLFKYAIVGKSLANHRRRALSIAASKAFNRLSSSRSKHHLPSADRSFAASSSLPPSTSSCP